MPIPRSLSFEDPNISAWGGADPSTSAGSAVPEVVELDAAAIVEKEGLVKEILVMQEGLKALLERVSDVQGEGAKLKSDNEMLQTYIDNLTRNNAVAAAAGR